ncbi:SH2 domain-containing protein 3C isoform X1 [Ictidomys tridecemlineatus]|uniref:SH2 domain containing 3C n=3 Tax=Ictidomys tridecemlineatus TaxID=43179 RepID=I3MCQ9_ICTTR|nr:SH2 domain-containing protein 3C isoform X1 [Ictidomys tridecemlineatus]KAG3288040.1 SH2 domain containing 3C, transcript variant X1 [Ictidomys tridecemlineatus]
MTEGPKKTSKKFKFFKFKGFGSLSNLPRSFTLRRSSTPISAQSHLESDTFEATQDDMVTVPKSPQAYARSSDMYSHMGTMPRPGIKRTRNQKMVQKAQEVGPQPHLVPRGLPDLPGLEAPKEVIGGADAPLEGTSTVGPDLSAVEEDPTRKPEDPIADIEEERAPRDVHPKGAAAELETGGDYVKFSKEKYILDSSPEKLHKELEEELKLSSTDLRSHAWYHGRIPREVSETLVQRNGDFLIRDSLTSLGDYVLTCRWRNQALHFKINKVVVKAGESYTHIQYLFEQESFDHVPALVRYHVGSRKAVSEQSGAIIYCPVNRTFPLRYLEASYGLGPGKAASPASPSGSKGSHMKRRSVTMTDGLTADKVTRSDGCSNSSSLPAPRDSIRSCALSMDQIPDLHSPLSPISESPSSPAYSTVTRVHAAPAAPSATALPASPVARRSSEPQLCSGSASKPPGESDKGPHASPSHTLSKASPSPSLSSYSDPDSGHYCQLQPPIRGSREWAAVEATNRQPRSYGERLKELSENGVPEGDRGKSFTAPIVEATSSFNPATFQSLLIPKDNRPLEVGLLRKVKELLAEVDARTLARHVTKVDCLVARILGVTKEMQTLMGVRWGMELLTLPHGRQLRLDLLERFHTMSIMLAVDILGCTGSAEERAALLHKTIQLAAELRGTMGNMFSFAAVMGALDMAQISRLEQTWVTLRQRHTEGAILYEKKLKPFLKSLNEGKEGPPLSNTTFPHVLPLITLLECDSAPAEGPEPWGSTEHGVEVVLAHLEAARTVAHHGGLYHTNAEVKLQGFQARPELLEVFSTEFQMRLLWGSQGASSSQARRYEKFDKVLTALSHKLEPAVRSSEL